MCREESHAGSRWALLVNFCRRFTRALVHSEPYYRRITTCFTRFTGSTVPALLEPRYRLHLVRVTEKKRLSTLHFRSRTCLNLVLATSSLYPLTPRYPLYLARSTRFTD